MKRLMLGLLMIILLGLMMACEQSNASTPLNKSYSDFNHIDHWNETDQFQDGETIVFYYSPYCEICQSIQSEVTEYLVMLEDDGYPIYMVHEGFIYQQGTPPLDLIETPSILIYKNQDFDDIISGSNPILNYLSNKVNE